MTRRDQRAWAAALRRAALPDILVVSGCDVWTSKGDPHGHSGTAYNVALAYDRWLRRTLTAAVARTIVAQATRKDRR